MASSSVNEIAGKVANLPLLDLAVFEIIPLLNDPDSNFETIENRLSPAVAAMFLNALNSAYPEKHVRSIKSAVRMLGYQKMKQVIVSSMLIEQLNKQLDYNNFSFDKFHRQAHFCAAVSQVLGRIMGITQEEDLYTVSLLQNIGKLIISLHFKDEHAKIIELKKDRGLSTRAAEKRILGITHAELGAQVLEKFHIPALICDAVRWHNAPAETIPAGDRYYLIHLTRAASRIVAGFTLPEAFEPQDIPRLLDRTIFEGRRSIREGFQNGRWPGGFGVAFPELLIITVDRVTRDLKRIVNERVGAAEFQQRKA